MFALPVAEVDPNQGMEKITCLGPPGIRRAPGIDTIRWPDSQYYTRCSRKNKVIMKKPITWRLLILVAGTLLGLLAGLGVSAPATAAAPSSYAAASYVAGLDLDIKYNGTFVVKGTNYKAKKVYVKVVRINKNGRYNVVAHKHLQTNNGNFEWSGNKLQCGKTYKAHAYSYKDGWNSSRTLHVKC